VNEEPSLKYYSLDGNSNVTVANSTVLFNLSDGEHRLIMYAKDFSGNIGDSEVIIFTIAIENEETSQFGTLVLLGVILSFIGFMVLVPVYEWFKSR
jgi:hypothetical protein